MMLKKILKDLGLDKTVLVKYFQKKKAERFQYKQDMKMHSYMEDFGLEALTKIYEICRNEDKKVWFEYGSMLGAYREKGFIPYDYDIDIGMYSDEYTASLERDFFDAGFRIKSMFYKISNLIPESKTLTEVTLNYKGLIIDVFLYERLGVKRRGFVYTSSLGEEFSHKNIYAARETLLDIASVEEIDFMGIKFGIPSNAKECLRTLYGENFMTPIKNSSYANSRRHLPYSEVYGEMFGEW